MNSAAAGSGSGSALNTVLLVFTGLCTLIATIVSAMSIYLHLKNYRKPHLQRMVIRIMLMVPIYAISSLIALFSLEAAFIIDAIRDIYEAFVIYCFFQLLIAYMGGERSLLILLQGRTPKDAVFPLSLFRREFDLSDPFTFLFMKRGILQYVQVKPILAIATLVLKAMGKYHEGDLAARSGYLYVSVIYNLSICLSLYCLGMFWMCVNDDLKPFRPLPKFLCVKGILFFSFWQSIGISILVAAGVITKLGPYTDSERISLGLSDTLICLEMPIFAIAHLYAFSFTDFVDPHACFVARLPIKYALKDSFGIKDVVEDSKATLRGEGMHYREFESSEGYMHQGVGRDRRIRAGLRYSQGGKRKYWLPQPALDAPAGPIERGLNRALNAAGRGQNDEVYAPLLQDEAADVVHIAPDLQSPVEYDPALLLADDRDRGGFELPFGDLDEADEELFFNSKQYLFGDYNYPCIDASSEVAKKAMWDEEERILSDERGAYFSPILGPGARNRGKGYGAIGNEGRVQVGKSKEPENGKAIDRERDRIPNPGVGEARLKWTRAPQKPISPHPRAQTIVRNNSQQSTPSTSSSPSTNSPVRAAKRSAPSTPQNRRRPALPPDAVDLIVEDDQAAEEITEKRRITDAAMRPLAPGLRKVYRRGYVVKDPEGHDQGAGEIEIDDEPASSMRKETTKTIEEGIEVVIAGDGEEKLLVVEDEDEMVVRSETPPAHARAPLDRSPIDDEGNPWAW